MSCVYNKCLLTKFPGLYKPGEAGPGSFPACPFPSHITLALSHNFPDSLVQLTKGREYHSSLAPGECSQSGLTNQASPSVPSFLIWMLEVLRFSSLGPRLVMHTRHQSVNTSACPFSREVGGLWRCYREDRVEGGRALMPNCEFRLLSFLLQFRLCKMRLMLEFPT